MEGKRMEPGKVARKVLKKTVEGFRQICHLAYAKDTSPNWATWPTLGASLAYSIPGIDANITNITFSFEG
jgi:hypothetical protein